MSAVQNIKMYLFFPRATYSLQPETWYNMLTLITVLKVLAKYILKKKYTGTCTGFMHLVARKYTHTPEDLNNTHKKTS